MYDSVNHVSPAHRAQRIMAHTACYATWKENSTGSRSYHATLASLAEQRPDCLEPHSQGNEF